MIGKYTSIDNHYKSVGDILGLQAVGTEKIDGCNFSVHIFKGGHTFRSRNQEVEATGMFKQACEIVGDKIDRMRSLLGNNTIVYFEVFGSGIQKRVNYEKHLALCPVVIDGRSVALIDVATLPKIKDDHRQWFPPKELVYLAVDLEFYTPKQRSFDRLTMGHIEDMLAEKFIEGWVVKAVDRSGCPVRNHYGDLQMVKVKTDWYSAYEKQGGEKKKAKPKTPPEIIDFLLDYINFGRLHSVYSHGHENLKKEMSDMRFLPSIVLEDIRCETVDHIIWTQFEEKAIRKVIAHMLPGIMKRWFLSAQRDS